MASDRDYELGQQLGRFQDELVALWERQGPEHVYNHVSRLPHDELVALAMVNIGSRAQT